MYSKYTTLKSPKARGRQICLFSLVAEDKSLLSAAPLTVCQVLMDQTRTNSKTSTDSEGCMLA